MEKKCSADITAVLFRGATPPDVPNVRASRDTAIAEVRGCLSDFQDLLRGTYGEIVLNTFGLDADIPVNADLLIAFANNVINLLRTKPLNLNVKAGRQPLDPITLSDVLSRNVSQLKDALDNVKKEERNYQFALKDRDKNLANWQTVYTSIASIASSLFQLGGRKDLAERVRPTTRKQAGSTDESPATYQEEPKTA